MWSAGIGAGEFCTRPGTVINNPKNLSWSVFIGSQVQVPLTPNTPQPITHTYGDISVLNMSLFKPLPILQLQTLY